MRLSGLSMIWERSSTLQSKTRLYSMHLRKCKMYIETLEILFCTEINPPILHIFTQNTIRAAVREGSLLASGAVIRAVPRPQLCLEPEALACMFLEGVSNRPCEGD